MFTPPILSEHPRNENSGSQVRLPGRHHTKDHWTKVWCPRRDEWLDGYEAIGAILHVRGRDVPVSTVVPPDFDVVPEKAGGTKGPRQVPSRTRDAILAEDALKHLGPGFADDYDNWVRVGMCLSQLGDAGLALWHAWSERSDKYEPTVLDEKWGGFTPSEGLTLGSLFKWAEDAGWEGLQSHPSARNTRRRGTITIRVPAAGRGVTGPTIMETNDEMPTETTDDRAELQIDHQRLSKQRVELTVHLGGQLRHKDVLNLGTATREKFARVVADKLQLEQSAIEQELLHIADELEGGPDAEPEEDDQPTFSNAGPDGLGRMIDEIAAELMERTGGWPRRVGSAPVLRGGGRDGRTCSRRRRTCSPGSGPIPRSSGERGPDKVPPRTSSTAHLRRTAEAYDAIERVPHWPPRPGTYYMTPEVRRATARTWTCSWTPSARRRPWTAS